MRLFSQPGQSKDTNTYPRITLSSSSVTYTINGKVDSHLFRWIKPAGDDTCQCRLLLLLDDVLTGWQVGADDSAARLPFARHLKRLGRLLLYRFRLIQEG